MKKLATAICLVAVLFSQAGCSTGKYVQGADDQVVVFHKQLDDQQFLVIYDQADPKLRAASKSDEFLAFLTAVHKKLGNVQSATRQGFYVNFTTSGTRVNLTYKTKFAGGEAEEYFVWLKSGNDFKLLGYHINSNALIVN